jgi:folate-dependent phosphoribosylglycinamide formyltransferase PurN
MKNELTPLYDPRKGIMNVAGFMSGSGSNLIRIIEHERSLTTPQLRSPFEVDVIFSDNANSNANEIGAQFDIPVVTRDIQAFYRTHGKPRSDMDVRKLYDSITDDTLEPFGIDLLAFAGYMSKATLPLLEFRLSVNVHPADLTLMDGDVRKYTGDNAVEKAILAGETELRSTTHIVEERVDYGKVLMVSAPLPVQLPAKFSLYESNIKQRIFDEHQNRLKEAGDWVIFPRTIEDIARGRYSQDGEGNIHYDGEPIPNGVRL